MAVFSKLFRSFDYLRISHDEKKYYDLYLPLVLMVGFMLALWALPVPVKIFGDKGFLELNAGILQILSGFYIASLAAVATFNKPGMDEKMEGDPPRLKTTIHEHTVNVELTRRRFICLMFGYLSMLSIVLYFLGTGANLLVPNFRVIIPKELHSAAKYLFTALYSFLVFNLLTTTFLGLYYMVDRIHRSKKVATAQAKDPANPDDENLGF